MKRDNDLIREILLYIEEQCNGTILHIAGHNIPDKFKNVDYDILEGHLWMLKGDEPKEHKYILADHYSNGWWIRGLTLEGRDLLDSIRVPTPVPVSVPTKRHSVFRQICSFLKQAWNKAITDVLVSIIQRGCFWIIIMILGIIVYFCRFFL